MGVELQTALGPKLIGMRLARSVVCADGCLLFERGAVLTEASVLQLQRNQTQSVLIELAQSGDSTMQLQAVDQTVALTRLAYLFRHQSENLSEQFLFRLLVRYREGERL